MKQSKYDTDQDGMCDAPECTFDALTVTDDDDAIKTLETMSASMEQVGSADEHQDPQLQRGGPEVRHAGCAPGVLPGGVGQGLRERVHVLRPAARTVARTAPTTRSSGTTEAALKEAGYEVPADGIPNIDDRDRRVLGDGARTTANQCWAELDKCVMEEIVPVVPRRFSNNIDILGENIANYSFDQFAGLGALDHYSMVNGGA